MTSLRVNQASDLITVTLLAPGAPIAILITTSHLLQSVNTHTNTHRDIWTHSSTYSCYFPCLLTDKAVRQKATSSSYWLTSTVCVSLSVSVCLLSHITHICKTMVQHFETQWVIRSRSNSEQTGSVFKCSSSFLSHLPPLIIVFHWPFADSFISVWYLSLTKWGRTWKKNCTKMTCMCHPNPHLNMVQTKRHLFLFAFQNCSESRLQKGACCIIHWC